MKKVLALILALVMVLSLSGIAFAGTVSGDLTSNNTDSSDVTIEVVAEIGGGTTYHVVIKWDSLVFVYSNTDKGVWNPKTHEYDNVVAATWNQTEAKFYIENHSNAGINYSTEYVAKGGVEQPAGVTITATHSGTLDSADDDAYRTADSTISGDGYKAGPNKELTVSVSGNPTEAYTSAVVGSVVVTISPIPAIP